MRRQGVQGYSAGDRWAHEQAGTDAVILSLQMAAWLAPGKMLSLDEMTMGFKGRCAMVTRIKYKKEGDGFQCDCICEDELQLHVLVSM